MIDSDNYVEPCFASVLRKLGCCIGFSCIPLFGGCFGKCCYPYKSVDKGCKGVIQEFGRLKREVGDGMHYVNPLTEKISKVNTKVQFIDLERQNVMTFDKLSINIDSIVFYQITNVNDALFKIDNVEHSIIQLAYTTLRNVIGNSTLEACLSKREEVAKSIKEIVDEAVHGWGISIISLQIKDIIIPADIAQSLSSAVTAERTARAKIITTEANVKAKIITAEADVKAADLMRKASDILDTPAAMQIRSLEVIDRLAQSQNAKIIILPSDLTLSNIPSNLIAKQILDK